MLHDVNACCLLSIFNSLHNAQCIYRYIVSEIRTLFDEWSWSIFKILFAESIEILNKNNILNNNLHMNCIKINIWNIYICYVNVCYWSLIANPEKWAPDGNPTRNLDQKVRFDSHVGLINIFLHLRQPKVEIKYIYIYIIITICIFLQVLTFRLLLPVYHRLLKKPTILFLVFYVFIENIFQKIRTTMSSICRPHKWQCE